MKIIFAIIVLGLTTFSQAVADDDEAEPVKPALRAVFVSISPASCSFRIVDDRAHNFEVVQFVETGDWDVKSVGGGSSSVIDRFATETEARDRLIEYFIAINGLNATVDFFKNSDGSYNCVNSLLF